MTIGTEAEVAEAAEGEAEVEATEGLGRTGISADMAVQTSTRRALASLSALADA